MKDFKVNDYITLSLEEGKTVIYIAGEKFQQCKFLLITIPIENVTNFADIESVDEAAERLDYSLEYNQTYYEIPPETEFWGHCSNLQVWVENDYDTRILKSDLAFPILKRLVDAGNLKAERVFKDEIAKRLSSGYQNVIEFLFEEEYIKYLGNKELWKVIIPSLEKLRKKNYQVRWWVYNTELPLLLLRRLVDIGDPQAYHLLKEVIIEILQTGNGMNIGMLYDGEYINLLSRDEFWRVFGKDGAILKEFEIQIRQYKIITIKNSNGIALMKKRKKTNEESSYFNLSNGIYINQSHMVFTYENGHITGIGVWSDDKDIFEVSLLPSEVVHLTHLKELTLSNVNLKRVPLDIDNLKSLKSLSLSHNLISAVPKKICRLELLKYLGIGWNKITSLPKCLKNLSLLQEIHIFHNPLNKRTRDFLKGLERDKEVILHLDSP